MNKFFCWLTGGHKYADKNLLVCRDKSINLNQYSFSNRCVKCGKRYIFNLDLDRLIKAEMEEYERRKTLRLLTIRSDTNDR